MQQTIVNIYEIYVVSDTQHGVLIK